MALHAITSTAGLTDLSPAEKSVLMALSYWADDETLVAEPAIDQIAEYTCLSRMWVFTCINQLESKGYATRHSGRGRRNRYELHLPHTEAA